MVGSRRHSLQGATKGARGESRVVVDERVDEEAVTVRAEMMVTVEAMVKVMPAAQMVRVTLAAVESRAVEAVEVEMAVA